MINTVSRIDSYGCHLGGTKVYIHIHWYIYIYFEKRNIVWDISINIDKVVMWYKRGMVLRLRLNTYSLLKQLLLNVNYFIKYAEN